MFLENTIKYNPELIKIAVDLHQSGEIPANTYLIDVDMVFENTKIIVEEAKKYGISLYFMSKQFNRNPLISLAIVKAGIPGAVAVDIQGAKNLNRYNIPISHVGHLVQIPKNEIEDVLNMNPEVITVYSVEKAKQISQIAIKNNKKQNILLRIRGKDDVIFPIEDGGFKIEEIENIYEEIRSYKGVEIVGTVAFPCTLYCDQTCKGEPTNNFDTIIKAAKKLEKLGVEVKQVNASGDTSSRMIKIVAKNGGTHCEPGHGLFASTPWHIKESLPEKPSMVYVNEVSHIWNNKGFIFGGGFYRDGLTGGFQGNYYKFRRKLNWNPYALVGNSSNNIFNNKIPVESTSFLGCNNATDYMSVICPDINKKIDIGDTVIYGFRTQVFVTRAYVAVVKGVRNKPKLLGVFDRSNNLLDKNFYPATNSEQKIKELYSEI